LAHKNEVILMKRTLFAMSTAAIGVALAVGHFAQNNAAALDERDAEAAIRAVEAAVNRAVVAADVEFFERTLAAGFTHTSHSGRFRGREQWLADLRKRDTKYDTFDTDDLAVHIFGDTAVVTGRSTPTGTNAKGAPITGQFRFLRVWVKLDGRWQVVAFEGTRIATD
jgi:ketosteroid isomerase-like protein